MTSAIAVLAGLVGFNVAVKVYSLMKMWGIKIDDMSEEEKGDFLRRFDVDSNQTLVGLAVLGGAFSEGIDLVGEKLIGAIIVGVGLPQVSFERDLIKDYFVMEVYRLFVEMTCSFH